MELFAEKKGKIAIASMEILTHRENKDVFMILKGAENKDIGYLAMTKKTTHDVIEALMRGLQDIELPPKYEEKPPAST